MKKSLLIIFILLLTGCTNSEQTKLLNYLTNQDYNCDNNTCTLSLVNDEIMEFTSVDINKKVMSFGFYITEEEKILYNYNIKEDIIYLDYKLEGYDEKVSYNNQTNEYSCEEESGLCSMLEEMINSQYIEFDQILRSANIDKNKL